MFSVSDVCKQSVFTHVQSQETVVILNSGGYLALDRVKNDKFDACDSCMVSTWWIKSEIH